QRYNSYSVDQSIYFVRFVEHARPLHKEKEKHLRTILLDLMQRSDLSIEQAIQMAQVMQYILPHEMYKPVIQMLLKLEQFPDLSVEQGFRVKQYLLVFSTSKEYEQRLTTLKSIGQEQRLNDDARFQALAAVLIAKNSEYKEKSWAMHALLNL